MRGADHKMFERLLLGKESAIGDLMDMPSAFLKSRHRVLFHSVPEVLLLAKLTSIIDNSDFLHNVRAGLLHLALDSLLSRSHQNMEEQENGTKTDGKNVYGKSVGHRR
jgi:hypothetical protein